MKLLTTTALRRAIVLVAGAFLLSCRESPTAPRLLTPADSIAKDLAPGEPTVLISQVYGGGGNSGATYKNDFVELFNPGSSPVDLTGWSVQYASSAGTTWQVTNISGTIPAGGYYLVQESLGAGGTVNLPAPDASGTIAMSATAGKIALVSTTTALTGACPAGTAFVDLVAFGSGTACGTFAPAPSNTNADLRGNNGCAWTGSPVADFTTAAPAPRNSATPANVCGTIAVPPATAVVAPDSTGVATGSTTTFVATAKDAGGNTVATTFTWASSNPAVATVDASGVATGVAAGLVTITATTSNNIAATAKLSVTAVANAAGAVVISQIYGGGGNSGAPLTNDYIELFNRSSQPVSIAGWSVQYASAAGSFTQATPLTGTIPSGGYFLVQEAAGAASPSPLPAPDATGTINMSGTSGKVLVAQTVTPIGTACPSGSVIADIVSYGSVTGCGTTTAVLSNTTAAIRNSGGCAWTPDASVDFSVAAPAPRNSASATRSCVAGPLDHVAITGTLALLAGATTQLTATALDASGNSVTGATFVWTSSDPTIATVDATGKVSGVAASGNPVTVTATATAGALTKAGTAQVTVNGAGINWIDISSSSASFPPGFQTQLFATARQTQGGTVIPATFTFEAIDPTIATVQTVQGTGIVTGVSAPSDGTKPGIRVTATPTGGGAPYIFIAHPVTIETPVSAPASIYAINDDFGDPTPANTSNPLDLLIRRPQYTLSYNESRGTPNWVSYELDSRQMVAGQDRCNCFTAEPLLPADKQIFTSDYTNGGFDRGHMTRSADRTAGNVDNAITFILSNVVPQQADLNQGVWAQFENALADSAQAGRAVYVITGPLFSRSHGLTFIKGEGKIAIPDSTWKIALIGPANGGNPFTHNNVQSWDALSGLTILAVNMPNVAGVRNDPWSKYVTTVESIETATGYNFLTLLSTGFRSAVQYRDHGPVASFASSGTFSEGSSITFDASASTDPDLGRTDLGRTEALTYAWHFSDGTDATGKVVSHTFANDGNYSASLTVTDAFGWPNITSSTVTVTNVAPAPALTLAAGPLLPGETLSGSGSFTDPGADAWSATVNYGDGTGVNPLALSGMNFALSHLYGTAGTFSVTVNVTDDHVTASSTSSITVMTQAAGLDSTTALVNRLQSAGSILRLSALAFDATIDAAKREVQKGHSSAAIVLLKGLNGEIDLTVRLGRMTATDAATMKMLVNRIIDSLNGP